MKKLFSVFFMRKKIDHSVLGLTYTGIAYNIVIQNGLDFSPAGQIEQKLSFTLPFLVTYIIP